jgi:hypothetical protein
MMRTKDIKRFGDWSAGWKDCRRAMIIDPVAVSNLWQQPMPFGWQREIWEGKLGYRKRTDNIGEKRIERELFNGKSKGFELIFSEGATNADYRVEAIYHNMPLANQRPSSLTCFGFVQGFLEGMRVSEELELSLADKDKIRVCIPDGANVEQVLKVITKFIEENPETSHNPTRHLAYTALVHAFRCPK